MKKLFLTVAIILGFVMGSYAQRLFHRENEPQEDFWRVGNFDSYWMIGDDVIKEEPQGGLFRRGSSDFYLGTRNEGGFGLFLPGHNVKTHWDSNVQGQDVSPLGSGALLLIGFGAAYAMSKRKKED